jgi:ribonuclease HIII
LRLCPLAPLRLEKMNKKIQECLADLLPICSKEGLQMTNEREIPYGVQLEFTSGESSILLNVYYSEKKGISKVVNASKHKEFKAKLERILNLAPKAEAVTIALHNWKHWIGSDECGKGDYFGPLVVCGFYLEEKDRAKLVKLGVCDSKKLRKDKLIEVAKALYHDFPDSIECLVLKPQKYNELYANFANQKKNLNDLLAWCHSKILDSLIKRHTGIEGVFIDQFSTAKKASALLKKLHPDMAITERPDGERDLAVAAASIIARYQLLMSFQSMNKFYKLKFPMGAGKGVIEAAQAYIAQYKKERLGEVAKLHFKTTKEI